jgi:hypothetical protein
MSNFALLKAEWAALHEAAAQAEKLSLTLFEHLHKVAPANR